MAIAVATKDFSTILHDMRAALMIANGYAKILLDGRAGELNSAQLDCAQHITDSTRRIKYLLAELSEAAERGTTVSQFNLVDAVVQSIQQDFPEIAVTIRDNSPIPVFTDSVYVPSLKWAVRLLLLAILSFAGQTRIEIAFGEDSILLIISGVSGSMEGEVQVPSGMAPKLQHWNEPMFRIAGDILESQGGSLVVRSQELNETKIEIMLPHCGEILRTGA